MEIVPRSELEESEVERLRAADLKLRQEQLDFERARWERQIKDAETSSWMNWIESPTRAAILAAFVGFLAQLFLSFLEARNNLQLEREKFNASLITQALEKAPTPEDASKNLLFLVNTGLIQDGDSVLRKAAEHPSQLPKYVPPIRENELEVLPQVNTWPISYRSQPFHDLPMVDVMVVGKSGRSGRYAASQKEHNAGVIVEPGDQVIVSLYFHNTSSPKSAYSTAHNVRATSDIVPRTAARHHVIAAGIAMDNGAAAYSSDPNRGGNTSINSNAPVRLHYVPSSTLLCAKQADTLNTAPDRAQLAETCRTASSRRIVMVTPLPDGIVQGAASIGDLPAATQILITYELRVQ
jgi:hypothetical protein